MLGLETELYESVVNWPLMVVALVFTGVVAGTLAGLLGVGGGIVIVPVLYHVFSVLEVDPSVRVHLAVGTSLATIIPTSIRSMMSHHKNGAVDFSLMKRWAIPLLIGVFIGTGVATQVKAATLALVFASVASIVALHMAIGRESWRLTNDIPGGVGGSLIPAGIGGFSAIMGIGGGTLSVPILTLLNYPIHRAVGTAAGFGLLIGVPGTIGFLWSGLGAEGLPPWPWTLGYVSVFGFVLIVPATVMSAPWGAWLAHRMSRTLLRRMFALFLAITALRMFKDIYGWNIGIFA